MNSLLKLTITSLRPRRRRRRWSSVFWSWVRLAASCECSRPYFLRSGKDYYLYSDMSPQQDIFNHAIDKFIAEQEEVRTAAAFAAGEYEGDVFSVQRN